VKQPSIRAIGIFGGVFLRGLWTNTTWPPAPAQRYRRWHQAWLNTGSAGPDCTISGRSQPSGRLGGMRAGVRGGGVVNAMAGKKRWEKFSLLKN